MYNLRYNEPRKRGPYGRVGKKIKGVGVALFVIGVIVSVAIGIYYLLTALQYLMNDPKVTFVEGLAKENILRPLIMFVVVPLGGSFASWLVSLLFYGFGELIDKNT